jgi:hypothetical protein
MSTSRNDFGVSRSRRTGTSFSHTKASRTLRHGSRRRIRASRAGEPLGGDLAAQPCVEALEDRLLLSAPATFIPEGVGGGGGLYHPQINPSNPQEIYVASDMGGEYLTTNFGASWTMLNDALENGPNEYIPVQFTNNPDILYCETQAWRVSKSYDAGATWNYCPGWNNSNVQQIQSDLNNANNVFADTGTTAGSGAIYYSLNGGNTFTQIAGLTFPANGADVSGEFSNGSTIYLGTNALTINGVTTNGGLLIYNGTSWSAAASVFPAPYNMGYEIISLAGSKVGNTVRLAAELMQGSDVYAGATGWTANGAASAGRAPMGPLTLDIVSGTPAASWVNTGGTFFGPATGGAGNYAVWLSMAGGDINDIYAGGWDNNGMQSFRTANAGAGAAATWTSLMDTQNWTNVMAGPLAGYGYGMGGAAQGMDACYGNVNYVVMSDNVGIFGSSDGGAHWAELSTNPGTLNPYGSLTTQQSYSSDLNEVTCWNMTFINANDVVGDFSDVGGMYSTDGGNTWTYSQGIGNTMYGSVYDSATGLLYGSTNYRHDLWENALGGGFDGGGGPLAVSSNGGATWTPLVSWSYNGTTVSEGTSTSLGSNDVVESILIDRTHPTTTAYVLVDGDIDDIGGVYYTTDLQDGVNSVWHKLPDAQRQGNSSQYYETPYSISQLPNGNLVVSYAGYDISNVWKPCAGVFEYPINYSNIGGGTWTDTMAGYTNLQQDIRQVYIDPEDSTGNTWYACASIYSVSGAAGVWRTTNGGATWTQVFSAEGAQAFVINPVTHEAFVGTWNGIYYCPNITASSPSFSWLESFPFYNVTSLTLDPFNQSQLWVTTFGGGMWKADTSVLTSGLPGVPSGLAATVLNSTQVQLSWTDNEAPVPNGYHVSYSTDKTNWTLGAMVNSATDTSAIVSGLSPSTIYYFRVTAFSATGDTMPDDFTTLDSGGGGYHWWASVTTPASGNPSNPTLHTPSGLGTTVISPTEIDLTWSAISGNAAGCHIWYSTNGTAYSVLDAVLSASATSYKATNLSPGTAYWFKITTYNSAGDSSPSNIIADISTKVAPPAAPASLTPTVAAGASVINLTWTDSANNDDYNVYYSTNARDNFGNAAWTLQASGVTTQNYSFTSPSANTLYFFKVSSNNTTAEIFSNIATGAILGAPTSPGVTILGPSVVNCTWTTGSINVANNVFPLDTGFYIDYSTSPSFAAYSRVTVNSATVPASNWVTGLTPNTPYYFRYSAFIGNCQSAYSTAVPVTTPVVPANDTWTAPGNVWYPWSGLGNPPWTSAPAWNGADNLIFNDASGSGPLVEIDASESVGSLTFNATHNQIIAFSNQNVPAGDTITLYGNITTTGSGQVYIDEAGGGPDPLTIIVPAGVDPTYALSAAFRLAHANSLTIGSGDTITLTGAGQFIINTDTTPNNTVNGFNWVLSSTSGGGLILGGGDVDNGAITVSGSSTDLQLGVIYDDISGADLATQAGNITVNAGQTLTLECNQDGNGANGLITGALSGGGSISRIRPGMPDSHTITFDSATTNTLSGNLAFQAGVNALDGTWTGLGNVALTYSSWGNPLSIAGDGDVGMASGKTFTVTGDTSGDGYNTRAILAPTDTMTVGTAGNNNVVNFQNMSELQLNMNDPDSLAINGAMNLGNTGTTNALALNFSSLAPGATYTLATYSSISGTQGKFGSVYVNGTLISGNGTASGSIDGHHLVYGPTGLQLVAEAPPAAPTGLTATVVNGTTIGLSWTDHAIGETGYHVQRSTDDSTWTSLPACGAGATSYQATGLTGGTNYYFQVTAYNPAGDSAAATANKTPPIPGDINCDGLVDVADYDIWAANVGATNATWAMGDLNGDGLVDVADYDIWAANVGATASGTSDAASGPATTISPAVAQSAASHSSDWAVTISATVASTVVASPGAVSSGLVFTQPVEGLATSTVVAAATSAQAPASETVNATVTQLASAQRGLGDSRAAAFDILASSKPLHFAHTGVRLDVQHPMIGDSTSDALANNLLPEGDLDLL